MAKTKLTDKTKLIRFDVLLESDLEIEAWKALGSPDLTLFDDMDEAMELARDIEKEAEKLKSQK